MRPDVAVRAALAAGALAAAVIAGSESLALALADRQPQLALQLNSSQADALAAAAYAAVSISPSPQGLAAAGRQAAKALRIDPTNSQAAATLAVVRQLDGSTDKATRAMNFAQSLSRRNLAGQLWWIEYWSARGDVPRTLAHYDIALRTSRSAPSMLFPVLASAVGDAIIARQLAVLLAGEPPWAEQFLQQLAQSGTDLSAIHSLFSQLAMNGVPAHDHAVRTAIRRLSDAGRHREGFGLFSAQWPVEGGASVRNREFEPKSDEPTVFDWQLAQEGVSAALTSEGLLIEASSDWAGSAAAQLVALPAGRHAFELRFAASDPGRPSIPNLSARCLDSSAQLARSTKAGEGRVLLDFVVPVACPLQRLEISLQEPEQPGGASVLITALRKIR